MQLTFTKMHGCGNDFIVIDARAEPVSLTPAVMQRLADRHFGVGCDQILLLEPGQNQAAAVRYRIFNADGGEVEQCGNGARCIARYLQRHGFADSDQIVVDTSTGLITLYFSDHDEVRVNMGPPRFTPAEIPLKVDAVQDQYAVIVAERTLRFRAVSMGNPHAVFQLEDLGVHDINKVPLAMLGPLIQKQSLFPAGVNVGAMQVLDRQHIRLRVYERGAGETLACGTGACAAVVAGIQAGVLDNNVTVDLPGGRLSIEWQGQPDAPVWMTGPAEFVFSGTIEL